MNYYLGLALLTITTVLKLFLAIICGMLGTLFFDSPETSIRGLSYISVNIFLPCLLGTNLCLNASLETLSKFYWAPLLAFLPVLIGFMSTFILKRFVPQRYYGIMVLGCVFQNGVTFPLGLVLTINGLSWLTPEEVKNAQTYVFLYNIVCSMGLWSVGNPWIAYCSRQNDKYVSLENKIQKNKSHHSTNVFAQSNQQKESNVNTLEKEIASFYLSKYEPQSAYEAPICVTRLPLPHQGQWEHRQNCESNNSSKVSTVLKFTLKVKRLASSLITILSSPPMLSSIIGLVIGTTAPLHWIIETSIGGVIIKGLQIISTAAIPMQLIVLGCTMSRSGKKKANSTIEKEEQSEEREEDSKCVYEDSSNNRETECSSTLEQDHRKSELNSVECKVQSSRNEEFVLTVCTIVLRLLIIPAICFIVLHILVKANIVPTSKPFLLVMLLEFCAPSAVNATIICIIHDYHYKEFAKMIFIMYLIAMGTIAFWLFLYVLYLGQ